MGGTFSIHTLREEGDQLIMHHPRFQRHFYPRPPRGGRHQQSALAHETTRFLSTPSARRATAPAVVIDLAAGISIHALREEGDVNRKARMLVVCISIHALREEGDLIRVIIDTFALGFLSTPSARRATYHKGFDQTKCEFLSTPSARRATSWGRWPSTVPPISIHALREEGDR